MSRASRIAAVVGLALGAVVLGAVTAVLTRGSHGGSTDPAATATTAPARDLRVYLSGYGYWDNEPHGTAQISNPVLHKVAGGRGTYDNPITAGVPYHCADGCLEWPAGTRFYLPALKRYVIIEDTCGDRPDSCDGAKSEQLVVWVGGGTSTLAKAGACEDALPRRTTAVQDPAPNLPVTPGDIC